MSEGSNAQSLCWIPVVEDFDKPSAEEVAALKQCRVLSLAGDYAAAYSTLAPYASARKLRLRKEMADSATELLLQLKRPHDIPEWYKARDDEDERSNAFLMRKIVGNPDRVATSRYLWLVATSRHTSGEELSNGELREVLQPIVDGLQLTPRCIFSWRALSAILAQCGPKYRGDVSHINDAIVAALESRDRPREAAAKSYQQHNFGSLMVPAAECGVLALFEGTEGEEFIAKYMCSNVREVFVGGQMAK